jgi:AbrB family looped-hinge helix DNA binding protein
MPSATITSKGQVTLPKRVRDELGLKVGDLVEFIIESGGRVHLRACNRDITELRGMLREPGRKPVSISDMAPSFGRGRRSG